MSAANVIGEPMPISKRTAKERLLDGLNRLLERRGKIVFPREELYEWQLNPIREATHNPTVLSEEARRYLRPDNPILVDLERRYAV